MWMRSVSLKRTALYACSPANAYDLSRIAKLTPVPSG